MSKFEVGNKVWWDDVMGHSEEGIVVETQFHHYVIGRMVDGELVAHGYVRFDEPTLRKVDSELTQATTKVEALAENLKHLDKPGANDTPHYWWMATSRGVAFTGRGRFWGTKVNGGRNKPRGALAMDKASTEFRPVSADSSCLSRSALVRWFPVALENTTYSDAIARHFTWMGQEGLRVTPGFVFGHRLSSKYDGRRYFDKEWAPNELWGNKAQVNRYHSCKTY